MAAAESTTPVLSARGLRTQAHGPRHGVMRRRGKLLGVVDGLDLDLHPGGTVWLVGEPGSGVAQAGELLAGRVPPQGGSLHLLGTDVTTPGRRQRALFGTAVASLVADGWPALPAKRTPRQVVEALLAQRQAPDGDADRLLHDAGVAPGDRDTPVNRLGEDVTWQVRVAALAAQAPRLVVRTAAFDGVPQPVQLALARVLDELGADGAATVVLADQLPTTLADHERALVLCGGRPVELLGPGDVDHPLHPYARTLLPGAAPGQDPSAAGQPTAPAGHRGCPFRDRCVKAQARCAEMPALSRPLGATHPVACHFPEDPRRPGGPGEPEPTAHEFAQG